MISPMGACRDPIYRALIPQASADGQGAMVEHGVGTRGGVEDGWGPCACPPWGCDPVE